ncbi:uncharacterized protein BO97DRAFT_8192 [Aspergillus homomorphus CBS 101889]|uniref:Uncharacterized protein n=1 Tax=Aspergillus homomorphus (strain CBS 101889) TaxID=1450537 RepID=A0A395IBA5_ASPHC|nr:hypothetical protein BO97DRAFT_8192 [Aspergillus homomorphus CBS 101889]RAL17520.1 hypothetical protein BO97DRAFT_8192 [Aspergillus homomorphus CBS 101889]
MVLQDQEQIPARSGLPGNDEDSSTGRATADSMTRYSHLVFAESIPSEESYIFDAIRAYSSSDELTQRHNPARQIQRDLDSRVAANAATFSPPTARDAAGLPRLPHREPRYFTEKESASPGWHPSAPGNSRLLSIDEGRAIVPSTQDESLKRNLLDVLHFQNPTISLNDPNDASKSSQWFEHDFPANPIYPAYPPPVRSPTPPGLPTFGTPEAVNYSSRFHVRSATVNNQNQQATASSSSRFYGGGASESTRTASYGDRIRRILSFSSSIPPQAPRQVPTVARAEDGTAVQGRFPYRQSGHGVGVVRRMEDHTFPQRALSPAPEESTNEHGDSTHHRKPDREPSSPQRDTPWRLTPARIGPVVRTSHHSARGHFSSVAHIHAHDSLQRPISANTALTTTRVDSFHTCASQLFNPALLRQQMSFVDGQGPEITHELPACSLVPTESPTTTSTRPDPCAFAHGQLGSWLQCLPRGSSCFFCCLGGRDDPDTVVYSNTSSRETYETARSHPSNDNLPGSPGDDEEASESTQHPAQWISEAWKSVHGFAARNVGTMGRMLN